FWEQPAIVRQTTVKIVETYFFMIKQSPFYAPFQLGSVPTLVRSIHGPDLPAIPANGKRDRPGIRGVNGRNPSTTEPLTQLAAGPGRGGITSIGDDDKPWLDGIEEAVGQRFALRWQARHDNLGPQIGLTGKERILSGFAQVGQQQNARALEVATQDDRIIIRL